VHDYRRNSLRSDTDYDGQGQKFEARGRQADDKTYRGSQVEDARTHIASSSRSSDGRPRSRNQQYRKFYAAQQQRPQQLLEYQLFADGQDKQSLYAAAYEQHDYRPTHTVPPAVPDAPDLSKTTLTGYELLALEQSKLEHGVRPLYRKFEHLNHRVLLHLQDELAEYEEQLRALDEFIAQTTPMLDENTRQPSTRRGEAYAGNEMHYRRRALLGNIFVKTEQYS